jgi:hypothetical protein
MSMQIVLAQKAKRRRGKFFSELIQKMRLISTTPHLRIESGFSSFDYLLLMKNADCGSRISVLGHEILALSD